MCAGDLEDGSGFTTGLAEQVNGLVATEKLAAGLGVLLTEICQRDLLRLKAGLADGR